jgi:hypothetical protein
MNRKSRAEGRANVPREPGRDGVRQGNCSVGPEQVLETAPLWKDAGPPTPKASDVLHFVPGPCQCKWCKGQRG